MRIVVALCACVGLSCTGAAPARDPVALSIQLATRNSCGALSAQEYDISCMEAAVVVVKDAASNQVLQTTCTTLAQRKNKLSDITISTTPILSFSGISTNNTVRFELYGLHDKSTATPCDDPADVSNWLIWGRSGDVDLAASNDSGTAIVVTVVLDCRDCRYDCNGGACFGCGGVGSPSCPAEFPDSFCVPSLDFQCARSCTEDADCFGGARTCVDGNCDRFNDGKLCAPCGRVGVVVSGCDDGNVCVGRPGETQGFCASPCPTDFCPGGMRCNRVGNNLSVIQ
jgi:hypothetical protein